MKKSRFLIGILVLAVMLMGAGYAAWTQGVPVNVTASAGEMDLLIGDMDELNKSSEHVEASSSVTDYAVTGTVTNIYPGAYGVFGFTVDNAGTMGVMYDDDASGEGTITITKDGSTLSNTWDNGGSSEDIITLEYALKLEATDATTDWMTFSDLETALEDNVIGPEDASTIQNIYVKVSMADITDDTYEEATVSVSTGFLYQSTNQASSTQAQLDQ